MKTVLGSGFGDEGKGLTTSFLCSETRNPIVVRVNGGHQAGHTVYHENESHVFSNFGSGTLQGAPTLWSHFCTFNPIDTNIESFSLENPYLFVHGLCPVTTPYDVIANQTRESSLRHGSVGMGFGTTIQRQEDYFKLFVQDLPFEKVVIAKLKNIAAYYGIRSVDITQFLNHTREVLKKITIVSDYSILRHYSPISEGAQGILLDMDFGFFPNVTRSNTTSKNAYHLAAVKEVFYATRTYQTRHGNGYMTNEHLPLELVNTENETNVQCEWQGTFRKSVLDIDLLNYAFTCDNNFHTRYVQKNLVITCVDQTGEDIDVTVGGKVKRIHVTDLTSLLLPKFNRVLMSYGPSATDIIEITKKLHV